MIKSFNKTPETIFGGPVNYIDYFEDSMPDENILFPFVHKPLFFKDEHELRFLTYVDPNSRLYKKYLKMNGKNIQIDIDILIESIFLFPSSELWIYDLLKSIVKRYNLNKKVKISKLHDDYDIIDKKYN